MKRFAMNHIGRNLTVFDAHCLTNGHAFEAYDFSDFEYGERLIRTSDGFEYRLLPTKSGQARILRKSVF